MNIPHQDPSPADLAAASSDSVHVVPLGGVGEFGMNCMAVCNDGSFVVIDCGRLFPDNDILGIDSLLPDYTWILDNADKCLGIILTHGHEDHIGSMPYLLAELDVPVYGTRLTIAMIERKLEEFNLLKSVKRHFVPFGDKVDLGPFSFEYVQVSHSIPDAAAVALHTPLGVFVHTGDFRFDYTPVKGAYTDIKRLAELGEEGVYCLMSDSTNVQRPGFSTSEAVIRDTLADIITESEGRVWITMFSSNIHRLQGIIESAHAAGRKILVIGRSLRTNLETALDIGHITLPDDDMLLNVNAFKSHSRDKLVVVCTGSQGEHRSAMSAISRESHRRVHIDEGDTLVFSARVIPGKDRHVGHLQDQLLRLGAKVITSKDASVHTSGHAYQEEQKLMISLLKPDHFVPVHGDYRMLVKHADIARDLGVPDVSVIENGDVLQFRGDRDAATVAQVSAGKLIVDGKSITPLDDEVLRDRRRIARAGTIVAIVGIDIDDGTIVTDPEFIQLGAVELNREDVTNEEASSYVLSKLSELTEKKRRDPDTVAEQMRLAVRRYYRRTFGRKPFVVPLVNEY